MLAPVSVLCGGIVIAGYYFAAFDASVATDDGDRVMNFSLMQQQRMGLTIGLVIAGAGFIWMMFEAYRQPAVAPPVSTPNKPAQPLPWFAVALAGMCFGVIAAVVLLVLQDRGLLGQPSRTPRPGSLTEAEIQSQTEQMIRESQERVEAEKARDWKRP